MSYGMKPGWEQQINKGFAFILKSAPYFFYAKKKYKELKCKDLSKTACPEDLIKKCDVIKTYNHFFPQDIMSKKRQGKMQETMGNFQTPTTTKMPIKKKPGKIVLK